MSGPQIGCIPWSPRPERRLLARRPRRGFMPPTTADDHTSACLCVGRRTENARSCRRQGSWIAVALVFRLSFMPGLEDGLPMAGTPTDRGPGDPGRSGPETDASPGSSSGVRGPPAGGYARNVAVGPAGAVPVRRGAGGCSCPAVRAMLSRRSRWAMRAV